MGSSFIFLVYMGAEHGNDFCSRDLDGLVTWFGILGLASLVVSCADGTLERSSSIGLVLRLILLLFPWIGVCWTFSMSQAECLSCGRVMCTTTAVIWSSLVVLELFTAFALIQGLREIIEQERILQLGDVD